MRCWTRFVRLRSASPHEMTFPYLRSKLRRTRRFRAEHSALATRARSQASSCTLSVSGPSHTVSSSGTSRGLAVIQAHPSNAWTRYRVWFVDDPDPRAVRHGHLRLALAVGVREATFPGLLPGDVPCRPGREKLTSLGFHHKQASAGGLACGWYIVNEEVFYRVQPLGRVHLWGKGWG
ncbi:hypothetical protein T01_11793 [Trichinella spiralis]|uniref:Uncharacterized protein n=1 Tax=Trichinella spiralis TaxID=6334 RepID=A0A0V1BG51_TRISP|nr:hypothetical protein T01_11793 [Trichinella spiralis]